MRLVHLSVACTLACLLGLAALLTFGLLTLDRVEKRRADVQELLVLKARIDSLSVASDHLLLYDPEPSVLQAYLAGARDFQQRLEHLGEDNGNARRAAGHIDDLIDALAAAHDRADARPATDGVGPLSLPLRSRIIMSQVAGHGIALDVALDSLLTEQEAVISHQVNRTIGGLAVAAALFGGLCVFAFTLIQRRLNGPVRALTETIGQLRAGDRSVRVTPTGSDELADLAGAFNDMLDRQAEADSHLRQYEQLIETSRDMFSVIDSEYRYTLANNAYARLYGLDREQLEGAYLGDILGDDFFEREARPPIDRCFAGEPQRFEAERTYADFGTRWLRIQYYPIPSPDGVIRRIGAVATDLTDLRRAEAEVRENNRLLEIAGRSARFGGWSIDLAQNRVRWSDMVAEIHGMPHGHAPAVDEAIEFFAPEHRDRIDALFTACAQQGTAYDEVLQIVTTQGERRWVRTAGLPVHDDEGRIIRIEGSIQDITEQEQAREYLLQYRQLVESTSDLCSIVDADYRYLLVNTAYAERYGLSPADIEGRHTRDVVGAEFFDRVVKQHLDRCLAGEVRRFEAEREHPDLGHRHLLIRYFPLVATTDGRPRVTAVITDITELYEARAELVRSNQRLEHALETRQVLINSLPAHIALLDTDGVIIDVNDQWRRFGEANAGADPDFGIGCNYLEICDRATGDSTEGALTAADGLRAVLAGRRDTFTLEYPCHGEDEFRWFRMMASRIASDDTDAEEIGAVVMHVDVTERKLAERELNRLAYEDPVTGVLNRNGFVAAFTERVGSTGWNAGDMVLILDLEALRNVNDTYGYEIGDRVLTEVGHRLSERAEPEGLVGRIGGDEFVVYLRGAESTSPEERCRAFAGALGRPLDIDEHRIDVAACLGYTLLGTERRDPQQLLHEAELALFEAQAADTRGWRAYTPDLDREARTRIELAGELRRAIDRGEFELHYQPKVTLAGGELIACEALLRWNHPERGLVSPGLFIPIAEQSQLIAPIGDWVVLDACRQLREWQDAGLDIIRIAVNVSVVQFRLGRFTDKVREAIEAYRVDPAGLTLEITESVFAQESEMLRRQMRELHELGVRLSLDDFGTGYSSLLYLQQYPFDEIKIDQGFVQRVLDDPYSRKIVTTVLGIAGALGAEAVAEGVESTAVRDALLALGCTVGQGYYYSMPLGEKDFRRLLETGATLPLPSPKRRNGRS